VHRACTVIGVRHWLRGVSEPTVGTADGRSPDEPSLRFGSVSALAYPGDAMALAFSPDGRTLAVGGHEALGVHLYELAPPRLRQVVGGIAEVFDIAFAPGRSDRFAACSVGVGVYQLGPGGAATHVELAASGTSDPHCALAWSHDGRHLMVTHRASVAVYDVDAALAPNAEGPFRLAAWTRPADPDNPGYLPPWPFPAALEGGGLVAIANDLRLVFDGAALVPKPPPLDDARLHGVSPWDGTRLIASQASRRPLADFVQLGARPSRVSFEPPVELTRKKTLIGAFSPDGRSAMLQFEADFGWRARLFDTTTGAALADLPAVANGAAAWSADGARIALSDHLLVHVVDRSGAPAIGGKAALTADGAVIALAFDGTGRRLATLSRGALRVWERDGSARIILRPAPPSWLHPGEGWNDGLSAMAVDLDRGVGIVAEARVRPKANVDQTLHFIDTRSGAHHAVASFGRALDLTRVEPGADLRPVGLGAVGNRGGAADGTPSAVEEGKEAVARGRDLQAAEAVELAPHAVAVACENLLPRGVAQPRRLNER